MKRLRASQFRTTVGALAILGALLNVWVLTVHVTSVTLTHLRADGGGVLICHQGGFRFIADTDEGGGRQPSRPRCPICSGMAVLHVAVIGNPALNLFLPSTPATVVSDAGLPNVADRRLLQILNRGPPRLV